MAITIKTKADQSKEEQRNAELLRYKSLNNVVQPVKFFPNNWRKMSAIACKLYVTIWSLSNRRSEKNESTDTPSGIIMASSGLPVSRLLKAAKELEDLKLIEILHSEGGLKQYRLLAQLTPEEMEEDA